MGQDRVDPAYFVRDETGQDSSKGGSGVEDGQIVSVGGDVVGGGPDVHVREWHVEAEHDERSTNDEEGVGRVAEGRELSPLNLLPSAF